MRRILHIDMDAFFAAVEQKRRPELIGKPVVIGGGGDPMKRGVVSTASYEARKFGIHSAMPLRTAYKLCPHAIFLAVDYPEYSRVSRQIKAVFRQFSAVMEDVGIDEAYLDVTDNDRSAEEIARNIKVMVREKTALTCSIGIGPNKLIAKIASDMQKPDGLTIILPEDFEKMIWPLSVRKLWGIGPKTEARLNRLGINTIRELAARSEQDLRELFGNSYGKYLWESSRGIDDRPLVTEWEPRSASRETTFERDIGDWQHLARTLVGLVNEVAGDLKRQAVKGRTITVKIRYLDFQTCTRAITIPAVTDSADEIRKAAFQCMKRFEFKKKVRLIGLRMSGLEKPKDPSDPDSDLLL